MRPIVLVFVFFFGVGHTFAQEHGYDSLRVGDNKGVTVVPTNQVLSPAGKQVAFSGRPTDLVLSPDGQWLGVLDRNHVAIIHPESGEVVSRVSHGGGSYAGILFTENGKTLLASSTRGSIGVFDVSQAGKLTAKTPIALPLNPSIRTENVANGPTGPQSPNSQPDSPGADAKNALPTGLALDKDGKTLWAVLNLRNTLARIDLVEQSVVREIPVGNAPYGVAIVGSKAYVTNWAGRHPGEKDTAGPSGAGTPVRVDPKRNIASEGSVSVVDLQTDQELKQILVGLHPCDIVMAPDGKHVVVANANSDSLSVISTEQDEVVETISTHPTENLLFGSAPNALAFSADGQRIYVSNGTNNAVVVIGFSAGKSRLLGAIPTGWYPAGLVIDEQRQALYVANIKGTGSRNVDWKGSRKVKGEEVFGYNSHDHQGTVSLIPIPDPADLAKQTQTVLTNNRLTESISALAPPRKNVLPKPIPMRHGEPSVFKHVLYIIKENRTYDQVFGDIERGEGDPALCIYGQDVTPNHHKLVDEFVLLDNFYCSGVLSADGHQWTNEAYVTDYLEKAFGGFPRSYPYWGGDAMAYASSGFIWDNVLEHQKTLRVYGEFVKATIQWKDGRKGRPDFLDCYTDFVRQKNEIDIRATAAIQTIDPYLCPTAIGFPSVVPDIHRADQFIRELKEFETTGDLPNFMIMLLPNDHTSGTRPNSPTPAACVADNDLALGRVVEAVSNSKFWPETCIFVVQDDPQNGFDHIDGHRTVAMVISPYTKRKAVDSTNYNQTSMIRTMELILGLPPMNQFDASATSMASCFTDSADFTPYQSVPNLIPLDQMNPQLSAINNSQQRYWANVSLKLPLDDVDEADEDTLNRILWHAARGRDDTFPAWAVLEDDD
ncbi:alkaline phosphatase family protein [Novipirellula artificiosorum]|uniref:Phosphoesterase family protein n=1 Tax=Novipirellula artificiosorum TaxID=2528016 RepID=A0A5C6DN64_9BACT|nr:alkaline phosphatase family protein [Novipirellula artificiosorum]TWU38280.1 Phosphoesterase family protein [Novipirellula artificiosorum]